MANELDKLRTIGQLIGDNRYAESFRTVDEYQKALLATVLALMGRTSIAVDRPDGGVELIGHRLSGCGVDANG
ncbi:hypothetical protein D3C78_1657870 [compost metagenome]